MIWLISANSNIYNHYKSFSDFGYVDWKQGITKYEINDVVYIYVTRPEKTIKYKCLVEKTKLTSKQIRNDKEYWTNQDDYKASLDGFFMRLRLIDKTHNNSLDLDSLKKNGLKAAPQGPKKLTGTLLKHIEKNFKKSFDEFLKNEHIEIEESMKLGSDIRKQRISSAPKIPKKITVTSYLYERSTDIIAEALVRASGVCEKCKKPAPFIRKKDNTPYLEVHHKVRLADGGEDTMKNVIALCPNCHRNEHFGS